MMFKVKKKELLAQHKAELMLLNDIHRNADGENIVSSVSLFGWRKIILSPA